MNFSVLMSLYQKEQPQFLQQCLDSLKNQTIPIPEIVIVFDGPITQKLKQVINHYSTLLPIKIVSLPDNLGLGKALNEGLRHCSFNWVFRMDTDDICANNRFEKQLKFIQQNPNIVLFGGQVLEFNNEISDSTVIKEVPLKYFEIQRYAQKRCPFNHMAVAYRKDIILSLGGYQHHLFMEDYNLWLRVIAAGHMVANLPDTLVYARVGNGMHNRRRGWQYIQSEKQLLDLKLKLKIQPVLQAYLWFLIRSGLRLLPVQFLGRFYNLFLRTRH